MREGGSALPTELHIVTTAEGADRARLALLSAQPGWFHRLLADYRLAPIAFDDSHIHVLAGPGGLPLPDIRSADDNARAADQVAELVRQLSADDVAQLHVSLAGGRKTLGFFAGYALSLWGRDADRMWDVLVWNLAADGEDEALRLELIDAVTSNSADQALLTRIAPLMSRSVGRPVVPRLISFGRDEAQQLDVPATIAAAVTRGRVSIDLTHGFRHLGMLGLMSSFMLERLGHLRVEGLWYGALDMTENGKTPVLQLDGLPALQRWIAALEHFDASGNYAVFAPLLERDGVPRDKADCLRDASFHEATLNLGDAARKLQTFLPVLKEPLPGPSGLFQQRLAERLAWAREASLAEQQRLLAHRALDRGDLLRAAIFGYESLITRLCAERGLNPHDPNHRREVDDGYKEWLGNDAQAGWQREAYWTLKNLRNAMAHGTRPSIARHIQLLRDPQALAAALQDCLVRLRQA